MSAYDIKARVNFTGEVTIRKTDSKRELVCVEWENMDSDEPLLLLEWSLPLTDIQYDWYPGCGFNRSLRVDWYGPVISRIASGTPVFCFYNTQGVNRFTAALSDAVSCTLLKMGVREEDGMLLCSIEVQLDATGETHGYSAVLYRDRDGVSFAESIRRVSAFWENECGYAPMPVPEIAKQPMYSFWYSFHQATIAQDVETECARAAELGFSSVIVDDGWQTEDGNRGYGYTGDWEAAPGKLPDMAKHVENVHALGLKYILWYSVPFVGRFSKHWDEFKDMLLDYYPANNAGALDPRYPRVREFLVNTYRNALLAWKLDGFKLDFIDRFKTDGGARPAFKPGMDTPVLETAVRKLMTDIMTALKAIKPDIMIEFRQGYIGPVMRTYGNMFRVADCPADPISNRVGSIDLRLLSGSTAVHTDMLMWHRDDKDEACALQILSGIFAVMQFSVKLELLTESRRKLLGFWMNFMADNRMLLIDAPIEVESPQNLYTLARVQGEGREIIAVYEACKAVKLTSDETILLNASYARNAVLTNEGSSMYSAETYDCRGDKVWSGSLTVNGAACIPVPPCGLIKLRQI